MLIFWRLLSFFFFSPTRKMYMRKIDIFSRLFCYSTSVILLNIREWKYLGGCYNTLGTQLLSIKKLLILHCSILVLFECWVHVWVSAHSIKTNCCRTAWQTCTWTIYASETKLILCIISLQYHVNWLENCKKKTIFLLRLYCTCPKLNKGNPAS